MRISNTKFSTKISYTNGDIVCFDVMKEIVKEELKKDKIGKFWAYDLFIREQAKYFTPHTQMVYIAYHSYVDENGITFAGYRRIARDLACSKNTVMKAVKELEVSHLVGRLRNKNGKVSYLKILSVPEQVEEWEKASQLVGHKEDNIKESVKEEKNEIKKEPYKGREQLLNRLEKDGRLDLVKKYTKNIPVI